MQFDEAMAALESLEAHGIELGLARVRRLLGAMGNPEQRFPSIHIAGTNGKGSTAIYVASVLQQAGFRTGLYTSPHLSRFTERISISGNEISPEKVAALTEQIFAVIGSLGPGFRATFFEVTTAMAFAYFAEQQVDFAIIETGLGGRLDATNVVRPRVSVITNVALEHTDYLGESLEQIAREKGGIVKNSVDVVTGERDPAMLKIFQEICEGQKARLIRLDHEITLSSVALNRADGSRRFDCATQRRRWVNMSVSMLGEHQVRNAAVALGVLEVLMGQGIVIAEDAVRQGLSAARWPGRMEVVSRDPLIILDGAHNPHAAAALKTAVEKDLSYRRLVLVIGILKDKDILSVVTPLLPLADRLILTRPSYFRSADPGFIAGQINKPGLQVDVTDTIPKAIDEGLSLCKTDDLLLITGSLYTVGEARDYLTIGKSRPSWS
jgi:dihydrofolate synthase/folylpolyglutamate synthase